MNEKTRKAVLRNLRDIATMANEKIQERREYLSRSKMPKEAKEIIYRACDEKLKTLDVETAMVVKAEMELS